jgi:hypothetical protein
MTRQEIEAELARLRAAAPTRIADFAARRAARIVELEAALPHAPDAAPMADPKVEAALRFAGGGDQFDRNRRS